jgi:thymidylate kinase
VCLSKCTSRANLRLQAKYEQNDKLSNYDRTDKHFFDLSSKIRRAKEKMRSVDASNDSEDTEAIPTDTVNQVS